MSDSRGEGTMGWLTNLLTEEWKRRAEEKTRKFLRRLSWPKLVLLTLVLLVGVGTLRYQKKARDAWRSLGDTARVAFGTTGDLPMSEPVRKEVRAARNQLHLDLTRHLNAELVAFQRTGGLSSLFNGWTLGQLSVALDTTPRQRPVLMRAILA